MTQKLCFSYITIRTHIKGKKKKIKGEIDKEKTKVRKAIILNFSDFIK